MHNNESGPGPAPTLVVFFRPRTGEESKREHKNGKKLPIPHYYYYYRGSPTRIHTQKKEKPYVSILAPQIEIILAAAPEEPTTDLGSQVRERGEERRGKFTHSPSFVHNSAPLYFGVVPTGEDECK